MPASLRGRARGWRAVTCGGPHGRGQVGGRHHGNTFIVLGVAGLNGPQVAVTPGAEAPREVQGVHSLRLDLTEDGLTHRLELSVHLRLAYLERQAHSWW